MRIYAIKAPDDQKWVQFVRKELDSGTGRFGWSWRDDCDLVIIQEIIDEQGWNALNECQQESYQRFLLDLVPNDYVVYINVPEWGRCTLARVVLEYFWKFDNEDFNHCFGVDKDSVYEFDRNDARVPPYLQARLKLQGRRWQIYAEKEFERLLVNLENQDETVATPDSSLQYLQEDLCSVIQKNFPNKALERFIEKLFKKIPGVKEVQQKGSWDYGADLIVKHEFELISGVVPTQTTVVVQIKSWEGEMNDLSVVKDIRRAFEKYPDADAGLIVSTVVSASVEINEEIERLKDEANKNVSLLIGEDFAKFVMHYGRNLFV